MNKIIICIGISGSGKSTWTTEYIRENANTLRINRDSIRLGLVGSLEGYYQRSDLNKIENRVTSTENIMFRSLLLGNYDIILDNTNLKKEYVNRWINESLDFEHKAYFKLFDIDIQKAKDRVGDRDSLIEWGETLDRVKYLSYIDRQLDQYQSIKKHIEEYYKDFIIK